MMLYRMNWLVEYVFKHTFKHVQISDDSRKNCKQEHRMDRTVPMSSNNLQPLTRDVQKVATLCNDVLIKTDTILNYTPSSKASEVRRTLPVCCLLRYFYLPFLVWCFQLRLCFFLNKNFPITGMAFLDSWLINYQYIIFIVDNALVIILYYCI